MLEELDGLRGTLSTALPKEALAQQKQAQGVWPHTPIWVVNAPAFVRMEHALKTPAILNEFWVLVGQAWIQASQARDTGVPAAGVPLLWDGVRLRSGLDCVLENANAKAPRLFGAWHAAGIIDVQALVVAHHALWEHAHSSSLTWADWDTLERLESVESGVAWGTLIEGRANPKVWNPMHATLLQQFALWSALSAEQARALSAAVTAHVLPHLGKVKGSARGPLTKDEKIAQSVLSRLDLARQGWAAAAGCSVETLDDPDHPMSQALAQARATLARRIERLVPPTAASAASKGEDEPMGTTCETPDATQHPSSASTAKGLSLSPAQRRSRRAMALSAAEELDVEGVQLVADSGLQAEDWSGPTARVCLLLVLSEATAIAAWGTRSVQDQPPKANSSTASGQAAAILRIALAAGFDLLHDASVGTAASSNPFDKLLQGWIRDPHGQLRSCWLDALCQQMREQGVNEADGLAWIAQAQTPHERASREAQNALAEGNKGHYRYDFLRESEASAGFVRTVNAAWERECLHLALPTRKAGRLLTEATSTPKVSGARRRAL